MRRPDDIPQDVWEKSERVYAALNANCYQADCNDFERREDFLEIANAILSERERCARAATNELKNTSLLLSNPPKSSAAWEIRNRIDSGEPQ